jgi:acyl-CoA thioester hydrolase
MEALKLFSIKVLLPIPWGDMDALKHVNNVNYFRYFEQARSEYYKLSGCFGLFESTGINAVIKSISCQFLLPLTFPDEIEVGARISQILPEGFIMEHYILSKMKTLIAFSEIEHTTVSASTGKPTLLPDIIIKAIEKIEKN